MYDNSHPALIAYQTQLMFNGALCDIYIKQPQSFNTSTGARTGGFPTRIQNVQVVQIPVQKMFKSGPGGIPKQIYQLEITFPIAILGDSKVKLNDFVIIYSQTDPAAIKKRYEIKSIVSTAGCLITLGLLETEGEDTNISYPVSISDTWTLSDSLTTS